MDTIVTGRSEENPKLTHLKQYEGTVGSIGDEEGGAILFNYCSVLRYLEN